MDVEELMELEDPAKLVVLHKLQKVLEPGRGTVGPRGTSGTRGTNGTR